MMKVNKNLYLIKSAANLRFWVDLEVSASKLSSCKIDLISGADSNSLFTNGNSHISNSSENQQTSPQFMFPISSLTLQQVWFTLISYLYSHKYKFYMLANNFLVEESLANHVDSRAKCSSVRKQWTFKLTTICLDKNQKLRWAKKTNFVGNREILHG